MSSLVMLAVILLTLGVSAMMVCVRAAKLVRDISTDRADRLNMLKRISVKEIPYLIVNGFLLVIAIIGIIGYANPTIAHVAISAAVVVAFVRVIRIIMVARLQSTIAVREQFGYTCRRSNVTTTDDEYV